jgi:hypothetical protein
MYPFGADPLVVYLRCINLVLTLTAVAGLLILLFTA